MSAPAKKSKYGNRTVVIDGIKFPSEAEGFRWASLRFMEKAGQIKDLSRQVSFVLAPKVTIHGVPKRSLTYRADFQYTEVATGKVIVEDKKGALTDVYRIKRHLMKSVHGIEILET